MDFRERFDLDLNPDDIPSRKRSYEPTGSVVVGNEHGNAQVEIRYIKRTTLLFVL